ncbi:hypothetical protein HK101_007418, partial [Irineochytrium annulatum]
MTATLEDEDFSDESEELEGEIRAILFRAVMNRPSALDDTRMDAKAALLRGKPTFGKMLLDPETPLVPATRVMMFQLFDLLYLVNSSMGLTITGRKDEKYESLPDHDRPTFSCQALVGAINTFASVRWVYPHRRDHVDVMTNLHTQLYIAQWKRTGKPPKPTRIFNFANVRKGSEDDPLNKLMEQGLRIRCEEVESTIKMGGQLHRLFTRHEFIGSFAAHLHSVMEMILEMENESAESQKDLSNARGGPQLLSERDDASRGGRADDMEEDEEEFYEAGDEFDSRVRPPSVDEETLDDEAELDFSDDERVQEFTELMKRYAVPYVKTMKREPEADMESLFRKREKTFSNSVGPSPRRSAANSPPATVRPHSKGPAHAVERSSPQRNGKRASKARSLASPVTSERRRSPTRDGVEEEEPLGSVANGRRADRLRTSTGRVEVGEDEDNDEALSEARAEEIRRVAREMAAQAFKNAEAKKKKPRKPPGVWQPREREVVEDADVDHVDGNIPRAVRPPREKQAGRKRWTDEEVAALEDGMRRYGVDWKSIVAAYGSAGTGELAGRTNINLKDK